jgi:hypothetical protein
MCEFTYAGVVEGDYPGYLKRHPKVNKILTDMQQVEGSVLTATYWAILPFLAGKDRYVKYGSIRSACLRACRTTRRIPGFCH